MRDEWSKTLDDGQTAFFTADFVEGIGGLITRRMEAAFQTSVVEFPLTREEVEAELWDF